MSELTREEVIGLMTSPTWVRICDALKSQKEILVERVTLGGTINFDSVERTAMITAEATATIKMYDEILKLDELLFGRRPENDSTENGNGTD